MNLKRNTVTNQAFDLPGLRLTKAATQLLISKIEYDAEIVGAQTYRDAMPEQKLLIGVILQAITDLCSRNELVRRGAISFLNNRTGYTEHLCELAGLSQDGVIRRVREFAYNKECVLPGHVKRHRKDLRPHLTLMIANA